jgi:Mitochondrial ribosomal subunit protein
MHIRVKDLGLNAQQRHKLLLLCQDYYDPYVDVITLLHKVAPASSVGDDHVDKMVAVKALDETFQKLLDACKVVTTRFSVVYLQ